MRATLLFDLDGTLVDTAPDLVGTLNWLLAEAGLAPVSPQALRPFIGHGAAAMIREGYRCAQREPAPDDTAALTARFIAHYAGRIAAESQPYPHVIETLDRLSARGHVLAVCTNKPQGLSEALLRALGLHTRFAAIVGADAVPARKPDPAHIGATLERAGHAGGPALFIGDSRTDERAARAAGLPFILFPHGYRDASLEELKPEAVIADYRDLPAIIDRLLSVQIG